MTRVFSTIAMSLDGFVAGPDPSLDDPLGVGGEQLHEWAFANDAWRAQHGLGEGEISASSAVVQEQLDATGATVRGRRMSGGGGGRWDGAPRARGWWGESPPFHVPVFVLTHHEREPLEMEGGTTFHF